MTQEFGIFGFGNIFRGPILFGGTPPKSKFVIQGENNEINGVCISSSIIDLDSETFQNMSKGSVIRNCIIADEITLDGEDIILGSSIKVKDRRSTDLQVEEKQPKKKKEKLPKPPKKHSVYFLQNEKKSYIGYTVDLPHRIRQHRGEIKGGAKCTTSWKHPENTEIVAFISGFPTEKLALSYEWHAKRRKLPAQKLFDGLNPPCHNRLYRFFEPIFQPKFQDIKQELQIVLLKHHTLQEKIKERFDVDCVTSLN